MFLNKIYEHPTKPNKVSERCWEETSVDLYGPLPSQNHTVVIQALSSLYPIVKFSKSTSAKLVIPVLEDVYDAFKNQFRQKSDNRSSFDSTIDSSF